MIYPLRRRHRAMIFSLSAIVSILFVVSLLARQAPPEPNATIPLATEPIGAGYTATSNERTVFTNQQAIEYRLLSRDSGIGQAIELSTNMSLRLPELLVYWSPSQLGEVAGLPGDHVLLGSWAVTSSRVFALPGSGQGASGTVILYSLSQQTVVASTTLN